MTSTPLSRVRALRGFALSACALPVLLAAGCNSGSGSDGMVGTAGEELEKPDGSGTFFVDPNQGGGASSLKLIDVFWGRLVDVHDIDSATGETDPTPTFRDFVINETVQSDGQNYVLETNPVTQKTRLIIQREKTDQPGDQFGALLQLAAQDLSPIQPKSDKPGTPPPFSLIARNSALVLRFNDLLKDDAAATLALPETVKVLTNYPPTQPYQSKRIFFDPNHGGIASGGFHSTRVVIDATVSATEAASMAVPTALNALGLPASVSTTQQANVSVRIPSKTSPGTGAFSILTTLSGQEMATSDNGPVDFSSPTIDVVRAMRSGNPIDENNGFLLDLNPPELLSGWPISVSQVSDDPGGTPGFDFLLDLTFTTPCRSQPQPGNIIELAGVFAEVAEIAAPPDLSGKVTGVQVRSLSEDPISSQSLLGSGLFQRTYDGSLLPGALLGCWVSFAPLPGTYPATAIAPNSQVLLRFSEPMDPATVTPFDSFRLLRVDSLPTPFEVFVGEVGTTGDLKEFTFTPLLPFTHSSGSSEQYYINLVGEDGISDLAGNAPLSLPETISFTIDPNAQTVNNGGLVLSLGALDELSTPAASAGSDDWRGQYLFDPERNLLKPRAVARSAAIADRTQAVPAIMVPFAQGVQTPLSPLGSKMMSVWRYCDVGFSSQDESNYNLDVEHLNWSPIGGQVVTDFYPDFEIRLSHSRFLPDEHVDGALLPTKPKSGLSVASYATNILDDPLSQQKIVHPKPLGYILNPVDQFVASTGTRMMPFPLNKNLPPALRQYYTWRDTAVPTKGGPDGNGIDLEIMADVGLIPVFDSSIAPPGTQPPPGTAGWVAGVNQVPTIGLPLLMEFRCYPAEEGIGLNAFDISLAINSSSLPNFRIYSTGGLNSSGVQVTKDPDLQPVPTGGFNPAMGGAPTLLVGDNSFYIGQMDVITRISRIHSVWIDTEQGGNVTDFLDPVVEPVPEAQPSGTQLVFAFRGASAISGQSASSGWAYKAEHIDPYGDVRSMDTAVDPDTPQFISSLNDITYVPAPADKAWKGDIDLIDTARFLQMRVTFVGNTTTLLGPEFSGVGIAWDITN